MVCLNIDSDLVFIVYSASLPNHHRYSEVLSAPQVSVLDPVSELSPDLGLQIRTSSFVKEILGCVSLLQSQHLLHIHSHYSLSLIPSSSCSVAHGLNTSGAEPLTTLVPSCGPDSILVHVEVLWCRSRSVAHSLYLLFSDYISS